MSKREQEAMQRKFERKPWEDRFQMPQGKGEYIAKICRDIESLGKLPTVNNVKRRLGAMATTNEIEIYMRQTRRIDE
jgi:hypothetical protein